MIRNLVKFIDKEALVQNAYAVKKYNYPSLLCAVVKSDAYGHGMETAVDTIKNIADFFAVNDIDEALKIEKFTDKPILIIGAFNSNKLLKGVSKNIHFSVFCKKDAQKIEKIVKNTSKKCNIHIKVNSGMHRLGISRLSELDEILQIIQKNPSMNLAGIFTHIGSGKGKRTKKQLQIFQDFCKNLPPEIIQHYANSETAFNYPLQPSQMARVGIALYGYGAFPDLKPVMSVYAKIVNVAFVSKGNFIGYGDKHRAKKDMKIAVLSIGYANGLMRCYHKKGWAIVNNQKAKIVANICMSMTIVDVSGIKVKTGDWAVILGKSKDLRITAEDIAKKCGTISYEILTNFTGIPCTKTPPPT